MFVVYTVLSQYTVDWEIILLLMQAMKLTNMNYPFDNKHINYHRLSATKIKYMPEMPHRAVDIQQALVITNYKLTSCHKYDYFFHNKQNQTFYHNYQPF